MNDGMPSIESRKEQPTLGQYLLWQEEAAKTVETLQLTLEACNQHLRRSEIEFVRTLINFAIDNQHSELFDIAAELGRQLTHGEKLHFDSIDANDPEIFNASISGFDQNGEYRTDVLGILQQLSARLSDTFKDNPTLVFDLAWHDFIEKHPAVKAVWVQGALWHRIDEKWCLPREVINMLVCRKDGTEGTDNKRDAFILQQLSGVLSAKTELHGPIGKGNQSYWPGDTFRMFFFQIEQTSTGKRAQYGIRPEMTEEILNDLVSRVKKN